MAEMAMLASLHGTTPCGVSRFSFFIILGTARSTFSPYKTLERHQHQLRNSH